MLASQTLSEVALVCARCGISSLESEALDGILRDRRRDELQLRRIELHAARPHVVMEVADLGGAGYRHHVLAL